MELHIDISKPSEIAQGLILLQALGAAHHASQQAQLDNGLNAAPKAAAPSAPKATPVPFAAPAETVPVSSETVEVAQDSDPELVAAVTHEANAAATDAAGDAPAKRRGRPTNAEKLAKAEAAEAAKAAAKAAKGGSAKDAAGQPVGAALKGIPARDLAAAFGQTTAAVETAVGTAPAAAAAAAVLDDPDIAGLFGLTPEEPEPVVEEEIAPEPEPVVEEEPIPEPEPQVEAAAAVEDQTFSFETPVPVAAPEPVKSKFAGVGIDQLQQMWREEGNTRGIHWMRAMVEKYRIKTTADLTREIMIEVLDNPEVFMPPVVA